MKSLQNQYNLIKEGKGNKEIFLKEAKAQFPQYITNVQTFDQVIHSLTEKGIINETITLVSANNPVGKDWFKIFNENVAATVKDTDKEVVEKETAGYDYKAKNNNNISTAEMLKGYYVEMRDPKNVEKTEEQIKAIVVKNLEKDPLFYVKDGEFGIRGVGYTSEHPGLPKDIYGNYALGIEPKVKLTGKYKSSGMEPVKLNESKHSDEADLKIYKSELNLINKVKAKGEKHEKRRAELEKKIADLESKMNEAMFGDSDGDYEEDQENEQMAYYYYDKGMEAYSEGDFLRAKNFRTTALRYGSYLGWGEKDLPPYGDGSLNEAKKRAIEKHLAEIDRMAEVAAWDHRIGKVQEKIEELTNKMTVTEGDDVRDYVDKKAVNELKKDIALLTKKKALYEKQKAKAAKKVTDKSAMQTAAGKDVTVMEADNSSMPTGAMMLNMADSNPKKFKEYVNQMDADPAFKTQFMNKLTSAEKEKLTKKIEAHSKLKKESWSGMVRELINKKNLKLK